MTGSRAAGMRSRDQREKARREKPAPATGLTKLSVWFPADQMAVLRALAAKEKQSETALVRKAVRHFLGVTERPVEPKGRRPLKELLLAMPNVGEDSDFERIADQGRKGDL